MASLRRYLLYLLLAGALAETGASLGRRVLFDARYRPLFKSAILDRHPSYPVLFFGTSRTGEALHPSVIETYSRVRSFNISVQYSSFEILEYLTHRFAKRAGLKRVLIEISGSQLGHKTLPWQPVGSPSGDGSAAWQWLRSHSTLVEERESLLLENLSRLLSIVALARFFDGSEQFGADYAAAIFGHRVAAPTGIEPIFYPQQHLPQATSAGAYEDEAQRLAAMAGEFAAGGVRVTFYVPPTMAGPEQPERSADFLRLLDRVASLTGVAVLDYSFLHLPAEYFRDAIHLSHAGGALFSRDLARALFVENDAI